MNKTRTYDISRFYLVAFFGGFIPVMILCTINCRWLKIKETYVKLMISLGICLILSKIILVGLTGNDLLAINRRTLKIILRFAYILYSAVYYKLMKKQYLRHIYTVGRVEPLLKESILYILLTIVIEFVLLGIGVGIIGAMV